MEEPARSDVVDRLIGLLQETGEGLNRLGHDMAEASGTHPTDMTALSVLSRHAGRPITVGELGEELGLSKAAASSLADRLEKAGHARRVRDPHDRRRWNVELTASAFAEAEQALGHFLGTIRAVLADYTADQLSLAERFLRDVVRAVASRPGSDEAESRGSGGGVD
ncbi:MarR family winged helix-turn-helix transcriptional regulator [Nakamurella sp. GG22]